jgi:predicted acylesterase/phospholipase RssA
MNNLSQSEPNIKHLVISGGGSYFYKAYGILKISSLHHFWDLKNIKTIYGTSSGAILSYVIALNYDWETLDKYIINRPWEKIFDININTVFNSIKNCGILGVNTIEKMFEPLLKAKDMNLDITLNEYYEKTGIEIHSFSTNLNKFELVDVSYKTHPNWKIIEAIYASCSLPVLFSPYEKENNLFLDGAFFCNYPLKYCIQQTNCSLNEILGLNHQLIASPNFSIENSSLFDYILHILLFMLMKIRLNHIVDIQIPFEIKSIDDMELSPLYSIYQCAFFVNVRKDMICSGEQIFEQFNCKNNS